MGIRTSILETGMGGLILFSIFEFGVPILYLLVLVRRSFILCFLSTATLEFSSSKQLGFQQAAHNVFGKNWDLTFICLIKSQIVTPEDIPLFNLKK